MEMESNLPDKDSGDIWNAKEEISPYVKVHLSKFLLSKKNYKICVDIQKGQWRKSQKAVIHRLA